MNVLAVAAVTNNERRTSIPTGITLDYEAEKWGATRLMLDGISNHLDAVGTLTRVSVQTAPDRIVIADDGPGYDAALLGLLYSTRKDDPSTIGQFGEGLKLVASAALRAGLEFTVRSRDWEARAVSSPVSFEAARGETRTVRQLVWEISAAERIVGSRTTLSRAPLLPPDVTVAFLDWRKHFLADDQRLAAMAWTAPRPALFVKGVWVRDLADYCFAYNLPDAAINRDRDSIDVGREVKAFWERLTDPAPATAFLQAAWAAQSGARPKFAECAMYLYPHHREIWADAFAAAFGPQAVLETEPRWSYHATVAGYTPISLPGPMAYSLSESLRKDRDVVTVMAHYGCRPLTEAEAAVVKEARTLVARADGAGPFPVVAMTTPAAGLLGIADSDTKTIAIAESALRSLDDALPVYIEEHAHLASGSGDFSREFELCLVRLAERGLRLAGACANE